MMRTQHLVHSSDMFSHCVFWIMVTMHRYGMCKCGKNGLKQPCHWSEVSNSTSDACSLHCQKSLTSHCPPAVALHTCAAAHRSRPHCSKPAWPLVPSTSASLSASCMEPSPTPTLPSGLKQLHSQQRAAAWLLSWGQTRLWCGAHTMDMTTTCR